MTNFDSLVNSYAEKFSTDLKREGFNQKMYRNVLGTSFAARMFFFENTEGIESVRDAVTEIIMKTDYSETLSPVEEIFLQTYNGLATALRLPLYEKELFFTQLSDERIPWYRREATSNRVANFTPNYFITMLAKKYDMVEEARKKFRDEVKGIASDVVTAVLNRATFAEKFWN